MVTSTGYLFPPHPLILNKFHLLKIARTSVIADASSHSSHDPHTFTPVPELLPGATESLSTSMTAMALEYRMAGSKYVPTPAAGRCRPLYAVLKGCPGLYRSMLISCCWPVLLPIRCLYLCTHCCVLRGAADIFDSPAVRIV